jgi:hypothetical protein
MQTNPKQVPLYHALSVAIQARANSIKSNNTEWEIKWKERICSLAHNFLPSGAGIDKGSWVNMDTSHAERIVIHLSYHHMDGNGYYDGWTDHTIIATPSFWNHVNLRISGRDRNEVKEDLHAAFYDALTQLVNEY